MANKESWLDKAGLALVHGIEWFASPKGQAVVGAGEAVAEIAFPPSAPVIAIFNAWLNRMTSVEAKGRAAADLGVTATGEQKAAAAIAAVTPDVEAILQQYKLLPLTAEQYKAINDAVYVITTTLAPAPAGPGGTQPPPPTP